MEKIIGTYMAEYNDYGDKEEIKIVRYPNGKYYIHYGCQTDNGTEYCLSTAGSFETFYEAERTMKQHRPTAQRIDGVLPSLSPREIDLLSAGLLALIRDTTEAEKLLNDENFNSDIRKRQDELNALLRKILNIKED